MKEEPMYIKDFNGWSIIKSRLNERERLPFISEREIWWCSVGVNVGDEEDGKGTHYSRPVLVLRKFSSRLFLGVPLTTQVKEKAFYHRIHFHDREQCVMISQVRMWDARRLSSCLGQLPENQFDGIREALKAMI